MSFARTVKRRRIIQWCLAPVVVVTIALGWKYPLLGFSVPVVMLAGVIGALVNGRYVCGNLCPRGSFLDRIISPLSRKGPIPGWLRNAVLRWIIFAALMGLMVVRAMANPADLRHWGSVFWLMCTVTTTLGIVGGLAIHPRAWCALCPIGTMQGAIGGGRRQLRIDSAACVECHLCEKACPFDLAIVPHKDAGRLGDRDCLKCPQCVAACPNSALAWPGPAKS